MAMIENARTAPFGAITTFRVSHALMSMAATVKTWIIDRIEAKRTADALAGLSPEMLDDIGLTPADIESFRARSF